MMYIKPKFVFSTGVAIIATLILVGCNEPGSQSATNGNSVPASAKVPHHADGSDPALQVYTPGVKMDSFTSCNLERVDDIVFQATPVKRAVSYAQSFSGWVAQPKLDKPAYSLHFDDNQAKHYFQISLIPSVDRPDVIAIAGNQMLPRNSGFNARLRANALPAGRYHIYLVATEGSTSYSCDNGREIVVDI